MAGIHEVVKATPPPQPPGLARRRHVGDPRLAVRAHVAQFERLVEQNRALLQEIERSLRPSP